MVGLPELWLPVVLAAVICFVSGFLLYMLSPLHKKDWSGLPGEAGVLDALRKAGVGAGQYMFPWCGDMKERNQPEFQKKWAEGPSGVLIMRRAGGTSMGPMLIQMVIYHLVVGFLVAYLAGRTLQHGADYLAVFRVVGTAATLAYGFGTIPQTIWYQYSWGYTLRTIFDGLLWGLLTAGVFGWLWPR